MFHVNNVQVGGQMHRKNKASWEESFHLYKFFQNFDHLFVNLKSVSFICSELVEHLIFVFCKSIMLTILN